MYLLIDAVTNQDLVLQLIDNQGRQIGYRLFKKGSRREVILKNMDIFLSEQQAFTKIKGLAGVNKGGTFSKVRQACVLLNALAWAWQVPVLPWSGLKPTVNWLNKIKQAKPGQFIKPRYNGPAVY